MSTIVDLDMIEGQQPTYLFWVLECATPRSYFPEPNRLQFSLTAEVVREICQHIYDSAARWQDVESFSITRHTAVTEPHSMVPTGFIC